MKALFAYDHIFVTDKNTVFSQLFTDKIWSRYLDVFDTLTIVGRSRILLPEDTKEAFNIASGPRRSFVFVPNLASPVAMVKQRRKVKRILTQEISSVDAVIARVPSITGSLAIQIASSLNKPWAVEVVGCAWDALWNYGTWQGKVYAPISTLRTRRILRKSSFAIYVSREFLQRRYPSSGHVAFASNVQIPESDPAVLEQRLSRINLPRQRVIFGLTGSLKTKYKGIQTALEAFANVRDKLPPFEFRMLGGGDAQPWQALADSWGLADCVNFCGVVSAGQAVLDWLDEVDIYIQPSLQEGLPRALVEAMSRGLPAIGSTAGGIPELLQPDCTHRPKDSQRLGELLVQYANNTEWQVTQAKRNFILAKEYSSDVLDAQRREFWQAFADYVYEQK